MKIYLPPENPAASNPGFNYHTDDLPEAHMNNAGLRQVLVFKDYYLLQISDPHKKRLLPSSIRMGRFRS